MTAVESFGLKYPARATGDMSGLPMWSTIRNEWDAAVAADNAAALQLAIAIASNPGSPYTYAPVTTNLVQTPTQTQASGQETGIGNRSEESGMNTSALLSALEMFAGRSASAPTPAIPMSIPDPMPSSTSVTTGATTVAAAPGLDLTKYQTPLLIAVAGIALYAILKKGKK